MSSTATLTMLILCGVVWGGFAYLIQRAVRSESVKRRRKGDL